jgi:hypothetical protein
VYSCLVVRNCLPSVHFPHSKRPLVLRMKSGRLALQEDTQATKPTREQIPKSLQDLRILMLTRGMGLLEQGSRNETPCRLAGAATFTGSNATGTDLMSDEK